MHWTKYSDDVKEHGVELKVLDWLWRQFKSIEANGTAWKGVGKNFGLLADNMGTNSIQLATNSWTRGAGAAFRDFLGTYWNQGAVWAGEQMGTFVASGFEIIDKAKKIATKFAPVIGWAWTAIQTAAKWLGKIFGININDLWNDVQDGVGQLNKNKDGLTQSFTTARGSLSTLDDIAKRVRDRHR